MGSQELTGHPEVTISGIFFCWGTVNRVAFLVDGFNLYHSLREAQRMLAGQGTRWLDLRSLCASYLPHVGSSARLGPIHNFSALAWHLEHSKPGVTKRHQDYIVCLRETGVIAELASFKRKDGYCRNCGVKITRHEEKESDVAIAVRLLDLLHRDLCDCTVLVTGDSDIVPAVRCARALFPASAVYACFPFNRQSLELKTVVNGAFQITKAAYARHQLPSPFRAADGTAIGKPEGW